MLDEKWCRAAALVSLSIRNQQTKCARKNDRHPIVIKLLVHAWSQRLATSGSLSHLRRKPFSSPTAAKPKGSKKLELVGSQRRGRTKLLWWLEWWLCCGLCSLRKQEFSRYSTNNDTVSILDKYPTKSDCCDVLTSRPFWWQVQPPCAEV